MAVEVNGLSEHYRDILQFLGRNNRDMYRNRNYFFPHETHEMDQELEKIKEMPHFDTHVLVIFNVRDEKNNNIYTLSGPKGLDLKPRFTIIPGLPPRDQTYFVSVYNSALDMQSLELVLVGNPISAQKIAVRRLRDQGWLREDLNVDVKLVLPYEFVEEAKNQIRSELPVHPAILQYAGLRNYRTEFRRSNGTSPKRP